MMKIFTPSLSPTIGLLLTLSLATSYDWVEGLDSALAIHGSGTSNPARCYGYVMEEMQARSKLPLRLTYRSVGSSIGLEEFINEGNPERSALDFGSGEIPLSHEEWLDFQDKNVTVLHLPALFGAVSFFHSVPDTPNLNLTSCLLARIFMRDITDWAHPDIREINPGLTRLFDANENFDSLGASLRIRVARREEGSSNTNAITQYLHKACPNFFPEEMVGALPEWPVDTEACRGTLGMNDCIQERAGTIGYNEAGIGVFAELQEISIKNKYGRLLTSQVAAANGGIGAKESGILPADATGDFSSVSLLDQDGEYTWPITLLTYIYVRNDLSFKTNPVERALLVAFLKALFDPSFVSRCETGYGFTLPAGASLDLSKKAIQLLDQSLGEESPRWTFEDKAESLAGAGDYVISANRHNFPAVERDANLQHVADLKAVVATMEEMVANLTAELYETQRTNSQGDEAEFTVEYEAMLLASLIIGSMSLVLVLAGLALYAVNSKQAPVEVEK